MSPYLLSGDLGATEVGRKARAGTTVAEAMVYSISDVFGEYAEARGAGDLARMRQIRDGAGPELLAELDGFDYPAAA